MKLISKDTRIYLAARFGRAHEMNSYANILRAWGFTVTSEWHVPGKPTQENFPKDSEEAIKRNLGIANLDLKGILASTLFICFSEDMSNLPEGATRGGRHAEFGMAVGFEKDIMLVGPREHVFHYLQNVTYYPDIEEWIGAMAHASLYEELPS